MVGIESTGSDSTPFRLTTICAILTAKDHGSYRISHEVLGDFNWEAACNQQ